MISYGHQWITEEDIQAVVSVLRSDYLTQGPSVTAFEKEICKITGAKYCVAVSNATAGLHIAVAALGLHEGEGLTTPITFLASSNCMVYNGLKPVFVDIDETYNLDIKKIQDSLTDKTRLIIPVHFTGQSCDMKEISKIAKSKGLYVIEDAAHAIGSTDNEGNMVGCCKYSDMTVFSFHPVKTITCGEGGAITTNSPELYEKLLCLRSHGTTKNPSRLTKNPGPWYYQMQSLGFNYRMTDMQAALGLSQLKRLYMFKARRREIVSMYNEAFKGLKNIKTPYEKEGYSSCFHLYVLQIDFSSIGKSRKEVMEDLKARGIGTQVHYIPINTQPYYQETYGYKDGDYPVAEAYYEKALSLPLYPSLKDEEVLEVIRNVKEVCGE